MATRGALTTPGSFAAGWTGRAMGYTHYWTVVKDVPPDTWTAICDDVRKLIAARPGLVCYEEDRPQDPPQVDDDAIRFNGIGDNREEAVRRSGRGDALGSLAPLARLHPSVQRRQGRRLEGWKRSGARGSRIRRELRIGEDGVAMATDKAMDEVQRSATTPTTRLEASRER